MIEDSEMSAALEGVWAERARYVSWARKRVATREDAEDVVQQAMERAASRADQLSEAAAARGWFWMILRRCLSDHLRARDARRRGHDLLERYERAAPTGHEPHDLGATCTCSLDELEKMPDDARALLERVALREESIAEVAEDLGLTPNATRVRAHRARAAMRARMQERCGTHDVTSCMDCSC
jgi:RNA polymerase sigma-70 factor (ECF subfamily)